MGMPFKLTMIGATDFWQCLASFLLLASQDLDGGASYYEGEFKLFLRSGNGTLENTEMLGSQVGAY